jgi:hypothetical protein
VIHVYHFISPVNRCLNEGGGELREMGEMAGLRESLRVVGVIFLLSEGGASRRSIEECVGFDV